MQSKRGDLRAPPIHIRIHISLHEEVLYHSVCIDSFSYQIMSDFKNRAANNAIVKAGLARNCLRSLFHNQHISRLWAPLIRLTHLLFLSRGCLLLQ